MSCNLRWASRKPFKGVSQLRWPDKDREVWFSLGENHEKAYRSGLHQLRNCPRQFPFCSALASAAKWGFS
jgi:hypothetical protein